MSTRPSPTLPNSRTSVKFRSQGLRSALQDGREPAGGIGAVLREAGHDAHTIREQALGGHPDSDVATVCKREQRALVTLDLDFSDIRSYPPEEFDGLIVLRVGSQARDHVLNVIRKLVPMFANEPLAKHLWIVEDERVRIWNR